MRTFSLVWVLLILHAGSARAGLECRASDVANADAALGKAHESNCQDLDALREAGKALRELSSEPACDASIVAKAQRALTEARITPFLEEGATSCRPQLELAQKELKRLTRSVKSGSRRGAAAP